MAHATGSVVHDAAAKGALMAPATTKTAGGGELSLYVVSCTWFGKLASFCVQGDATISTTRKERLGGEFLTMTQRFGRKVRSELGTWNNDHGL